MRTVDQITQLRAAVAGWRTAGERVALVPTMGNLHAGHLALVARARELTERVIVSIFVNPLQFSPGEDLAAYPRTPEADLERLDAAGADLVFIPEATVMYPHGDQDIVRLELPGLADILCGASRPGHFAGVATVVAKLFNMAMPDAAVFGEKDYQQLVIIRRMAADLAFPIEVVGVPTVREADGLAMSSRNGYLTPDERRIAPQLYAALAALSAGIEAGERDFSALEKEASRSLAAAGFTPDYVAVRRADDLGVPDESTTALRVLAAAWLGRARLIDNVSVDKAKAG